MLLTLVAAAVIAQVVVPAAGAGSLHDRKPARRSAGAWIEGYASATSVRPGGEVRLYVSTPARRFSVTAARWGWYPHAPRHRVWRKAGLRGRLQHGPRLIRPATRTWAADWSPSLTVSTKNWRPGDYLFKLQTPRGGSSFIPLVVRAPSADGRVVLVSAATTWEAYNTWGCCDLYEGGNGSFDTRSRAVSFDRPYANGHGAGQFFHTEQAIVREAERLRLPLDYVTDVDLQTDPGLLRGAAAVVSMGHDEYWSVPMRRAVTRARSHGTNLAFFGANAIFRRMRFAFTAHGRDRLEVNYKIASEDPLYGRNNSRVTADWPAPPDARPESSLIGAQYACNLGLVKLPGRIARARSWVFRGVHVHRGESLPRLIGPETDAVQPARYPTPHPIAVLLRSPTPCPSGGGPHHADTSYYVARSGAGVFDAGTIGWPCSIGTCRAPRVTRRVVRQVTDNVLRAFATKRAGLRHPVR